jgi:hypothetical protein
MMVWAAVWRCHLAFVPAPIAHHVVLCSRARVLVELPKLERPVVGRLLEIRSAHEHTSATITGSVISSLSPSEQRIDERGLAAPDRGIGLVAGMRDQLTPPQTVGSWARFASSERSSLRLHEICRSGCCRLDGSM